MSNLPKTYLGKKIRIDTHSLYVLYTKHADGPTVVFDAGRGCNSLAWKYVQDLASSFINTISYDRSGLGYSDTSNTERSSLNMVLEMKLLLESARVPKPYILVGHSFGGINVMLYACTYPDDVFGLILVDSCHENQLEVLPKVNLWKSNIEMQKILTYAGIYRLLFCVKQIDLNSDVNQGLYSKYIHKDQFKVFYQEYKLFNTSLLQLKNIDKSTLLDKYLIVISAGINDSSTNAWYDKWMLLQQDLAKKSNKSIHLIDKKSGHMIVKSNPGIIVSNIKKLQRLYMLANHY